MQGCRASDISLYFSCVSNSFFHSNTGLVQRDHSSVVPYSRFLHIMLAYLTLFAKISTPEPSLRCLSASCSPPTFLHRGSCSSSPVQSPIHIQSPFSDQLEGKAMVTVAGATHTIWCAATSLSAFRRYFDFYVRGPECFLAIMLQHASLKYYHKPLTTP